MMRDIAEILESLRAEDENGEHDPCYRCRAYDAKYPLYRRGIALSFATLCRDAADAIEELLAAVPRWISVEDELPVDLQGALVLGKDGCVYAWTYEKDAPTEECWVDDYAEFHSIYDTTHWMPLPEPPEVRS